MPNTKAIFRKLKYIFNYVKSAPFGALLILHQTFGPDRAERVHKSMFLAKLKPSVSICWLICLKSYVELGGAYALSCCMHRA